MQGSLLPVAVIEQKPVDGESVLVQSGYNDLARIEWMTAVGASTHSFKALDDGNYLVIIQAESELLGVRRPTKIEITAPTVANPIVETKTINFAQMLISASGAVTSPNYTITASASQLTRQWAPYNRFSGQWFVELAKDDLFSFQVTNAAPKEYWMAIIMRLHPIDQYFTEDPSILINNPIPNAGHGITVTNVTRPGSRIKRWRIVSNSSTPSNAGRISWSFGTTGVPLDLYRFGYAHELRVRLISVGGSSGAAVIRAKRGSTIEHSQALTYQIPQSSVHTHSFASMTVDPVDTLELIEIDPNQTFEIEAQLNVL